MQRNFDSPDESEIKEKSQVDILRLGDTLVSRATYEPGWSWEIYAQPTAGETSCHETHKWYVIAGRLGMRMDDGTEMEWTAGDVGIVPPGHNAWVIGDESFVVILF